MTSTLDIQFVALDAKPAATAVVFSGGDLSLTPTARAFDETAGGALKRAAAAASFTGKPKQSFELLAAPMLASQRVVVMGLASGMTNLDRTLLGGRVLAQIRARKTEAASVFVETAGKASGDTADLAAAMAEGAMLRAYEFRRYRSKKDDDANGDDAPAKSANGLSLAFHVADPQAAAERFEARRAVARGVMLARDLVNEPANMLGPVEFADRIRELTTAGVDVEILDVPALEKLKMGALLGVAQGSVRPARVAVMQYHGAKSKRAKPVCFIGKGVVFDTGGISMKPAGGMEDMKGDMGGAACVTGLMLALAGRKAHVNAIGLVGLVENMPSGNAQRPGDIVTSMSGQTIEVLNTDAEGRLVLADVMWYAQERFKPRLMIDLATLTGAIMVALGKEHAGLFSNDDRLAAELSAAGEVTGEKVWRMPLSKGYDKLIDSKNADMKNIGGRFGGAITAAQFLQRFVRDTPWAHLDVAGTAMDSSKTEISQGWASGWGVRLLDQFVAEGYEKAEK